MSNTIFFDKKPNETIEEFTDRLRAKKNDFELTWQDIADIVNDTYGCSYSESYYRKKYQNKIAKSVLTDMVEDRQDEVRTLEEVLADIRANKQRVTDERRATNAMLRRMSREDTIKEIAIEAAESISSRIILETPFTDHHIHSKRTAILNISDWHYGMEINNYWNKYGVEEAKKRIDGLLVDTIHYITSHDVSKLYVLNIGDLISGRIHSQIRIDNQEDVITQTIQISEILAEFLTEISKYCEVEFHSVSDNHSRVEPDKKESLDLESLHRIVPWFLKTRLADNEYVTIAENEYDEDMSIFECDGWTVGMAHGDKDKLTNITSHLSLMTGKHIDLICTAHMHHFACDEVNQCMVISNPSLMGTDTFAKNKRLTSRPAQTLLLVGKKAPIEDIHYIVL